MGFAVVREHGAGGGIGDGGVVAFQIAAAAAAAGGGRRRWRECHQFRIADCDDAVKAGGGFLGPFGGWPAFAPLEEGLDGGERGKIVAWGFIFFNKGEGRFLGGGKGVLVEVQRL